MLGTLIFAAGVFAQDKKAAPAPPLMMMIPDMKDGGEVPIKYSCSNAPSGVSPKIEWMNAPAGTQSFALLLHDPEPHPQKSIYDVTHWMIYNIPASAKELPEGIKNGDMADGAKQLKNIRGFDGYFGPCAPPALIHHYTFELYALDTKLNLGPDATRGDAMKALDGHILGTAVFVSTFKRAQ
ncbi:MAG: YbhB/YbcL family Raf kinase inhibitor-like protein [Acidobacteriota bacterium]